MSEQRKRRDSLLKSSISINSIRNSVSNFSKGLAESNVVANQIVEKTRETNRFKSTLIRKEGEYFRKRRENVRRKDREDELESTSITGITKKEGNIIQRSTRGFLGRILDFFGIILIGWFVNTLPKILKAIQALISRIQKFVGLLTGFIDGLKDFFTGVGEGIRTAFESLPKFDFGKFKSEVEEIFENTIGGLQRLYQSFYTAATGFARPDKLGMEGDDIKDGILDYGSEVEDEMNSAINAIKEEEGLEGEEELDEDDLERVISSATTDTENVVEDDTTTEGGDNTSTEDNEVNNAIESVERADTSAKKFFKSEEKRKKQREQIVGASSGVNNKLKNALSFLRPDVSFSGGGAGAGANFTTQFKDQAKEIAGGENKKLEVTEGNNDESDNIEVESKDQNYVTIRRNKRPDLKTDKNQNAPTVIITEGKSQIVKVNPMPNLSNTLNIPESNSNDNYIVKVHSLILNS